MASGTFDPAANPINGGYVLTDGSAGFINGEQARIIDELTAKVDAREPQYFHYKGQLYRTTGAGLRDGVSVITGIGGTGKTITVPQKECTPAYAPDNTVADASSGVRIVFSKLLGGWYVVRGSSDTPISGQFPSKEAAQAWLNSRTDSTERYKGYIISISENPRTYGEVQVLDSKGNPITAANNVVAAKRKIDELIAYYERHGM